MSNKITYIIATIILATMATLAILSMKNDSAIMDEVAHLPAGYSYLTQKDYRLNPEHPPLIKDLAAIPLVIMSALGEKINFPYDLKAWTTGINDQWDFGFNFMYKYGNNADKMLFWGRIPIILLSLLLGFLIFWWGQQLYGGLAGLLALFLYAFSPNIIAHSRFVTTDIAAAFGFFIAIYFFINWLKEQTNKNLIMAGAAIGIALLMKFSTFMLLPLFFALTIIWLWLYPKNIFKTFINLFLIFIISFIVIYPVYQYHVWNYPPELQQRDIKAILTFKPSWLDNDPNLKIYAQHISDTASWLTNKTVYWMADKPVLRAYAEYLFGLVMVAGRATGGNTTYFLGDVSNKAWKDYFPIMYAIKEPLALHILTLLALIYLAWILPKNFYKISSIKEWLKNHFVEFSMLSFIALYWFSSIMSNLNIGIRHVLPTFPFIYLLISGQIVKIIKRDTNLRIHSNDTNIRFIRINSYISIGVVVLLAWYIFANISIFPSYLAYFNELVGGAKNGYLYAVDSNLDWGQDLKRLAMWADEQKIDKIKVDYFGGGTPEYYLGDKFEPMHAHFGPQKDWLAVSATFYQTSLKEPQTAYPLWLSAYEPIAKIGYSIFVYKF